MSNTPLTPAEASAIRDGISLKDPNIVHVAILISGCPMYEVRAEFSPEMIDIARAGLIRAWKQQLQPPPAVLKHGTATVLSMIEWANSLLPRTTEEEEDRKLEDPT